MRKQSNISFVDLAFCLVFGFVLLFTVAVIQFNIKSKEAEIKKPNAEFLIVLTWQGNINQDVDLWIRDPNGTLTFFKALENGITHLDRDDLGHINDKYTDRDGVEHIIPINQEIGTIRGFLTGEWVINVHLYKCDKQKKPANCQITMTKLNPKSSIVFSRDLTLTNYWEEQTVAVVMMDGNGKIIDVEKDLLVKLVESEIHGRL